VANAPNDSAGRPQGNFRFRTQYYSYRPTLDRQTRTSSQGRPLVVELLFISCPPATHYAFKLGFLRQKKLPCLPTWPQNQNQTKNVCSSLGTWHLQQPPMTHRTHDSLQKSFLITECTTAVPLHLFFLGSVWPVSVSCNSGARLKPGRLLLHFPPVFSIPSIFTTPSLSIAHAYHLA
jgi:hypothetical protein